MTEDIKLPPPARWVAKEPARHGMHFAYRSEQARLKYGGEGMWEGFFSAEQMHAYALADREARASQAAGGADEALTAESVSHWIVKFRSSNFDDWIYSGDSVDGDKRENAQKFWMLSCAKDCANIHRELGYAVVEIESVHQSTKPTEGKS